MHGASAESRCYLPALLVISYFPHLSRAFLANLPCCSGRTVALRAAPSFDTDNCSSALAALDVSTHGILGLFVLPGKCPSSVQAIGSVFVSDSAKQPRRNRPTDLWSWLFGA